jgi:hypothetical protein
LYPIGQTAALKKLWEAPIGKRKSRLSPMPADAYLVIAVCLPYPQ